MADGDNDVAEKVSDNSVAAVTAEACLPVCSGSAGRAGATGRRRATQSKELTGVKQK